MAVRARSRLRARCLVVVVAAGMGLASSLLAAVPAAALGAGPSPEERVSALAPDGLPGQIFDVTDYGAVGDAIEAGGCDAREETPLACTIAGSGSNNEVAFESAVAAACAAGGGVVYIPPGKYRVLYAVGVNCSNVWVMGTPQSVMLPLNQNGQDIFLVCKSTEVANECDDPNDPNAPLQTNNRISGFTIRDDAPMQHGLTTGEEVAVSRQRGGDFIYGEKLDFIGGAGPTNNTAMFYYLSSNRDRLVYTFEQAPFNTNMCGGALASPPHRSTGCSGTIRGRRSGAEIDIVSLTAPTVVEESAGITNKYTEGFVVENMRFEFLGDETLNVSKYARNTVVRNNVFHHTPGMPSGGSSIDVSNGAVDTLVHDNEITVGLGRSNKAIEISPTAYAIHGTRVTSNTIVEPNAGDRNHSVAEFGILMSPGAAHAHQNEISGNRIDFDLKNWGVCSNDARMSCNRHEACPGPTATCDVSGDGVGFALRSEETGEGGKNSGNLWRDNEVVGPVAFSEFGAMGTTRIERNRISTTRDGIQFAIEANGTSLEIRENWFRNFGGAALRSHSIAQRLVVESNSFTQIGKDFSVLDGASALVQLKSSAYETIDFNRNELVAATPRDGDSDVRGIVCSGESGPMSLVGNWIANVDRTAIYTCSGRIAENVIEGAGRVGIWVSGQGVNNARTVVSDNWIEATAWTGIVLSDYVMGVLIDGNECRDVTNACVAEIDGAGNAGPNVVSNNHSSNPNGAFGPGYQVGPTSAAAGGCPGNHSAFSICVGNVVDAGVIAPKPERPWFPSQVPAAVPALERVATLVLLVGFLALARRVGRRRPAGPPSHAVR